MTKTADEELNSFVNDIASHFLAIHPPPNDAELEAWQPKFSQWNLVRPLQRRLAGFKKQTLFAVDSEITYLAGGNPAGQVILLLHGFGANKENWLFMAQLLKRHYYIVIPDVPGYGESEFNPKLNYQLINQAERLHKLINKVSEQPVHLVGNSLGGATAAVIAASYPELTASLTLMNSAGLRGSQTTLLETMLVNGENPLIPRSFNEVRKLFKRTTHRKRHFFSATITPIIYRDFINRSPVNHRLFSDAIIIEDGLASVLQDIKSPTLIMWGDKDQMVDVSCIDVITKYLPQAKTVVFPNVGHLPMLETPVKSTNALKQFWLSLH